MVKESQKKRAEHTFKEEIKKEEVKEKKEESKKEEKGQEIKKELPKEEKKKKFKLNILAKAILAIIGLLFYTGIGYLLIQNMVYTNGFNDGYEQGYKEAESELLNENYPLQIGFHFPEIPQFAVGDNIILTVDLINPTTKKVFYNGLELEVDSGLQFVQQTPQVVCDQPVEEITDSEKYNITNPRRIIKVESGTSEIGPETTINTVTPPLFASKPGEYGVKFCILYPDGAKVCPKIQKINIKEK